MSLTATIIRVFNNFNVFFLQVVLFLVLIHFSGLGPCSQKAGSEFICLLLMGICNVTVKIIGGHSFETTEQANVGRLLLVMGTAEMLHQVSFLPKPVKTQYAFVRSDPGMSAQMHINIGFGA